MELTGYNSNQFVKEEHVFIPDSNSTKEGHYGTFFFSKEIAKKQAYMSNGIGLYLISINHEGVELYQANYTNVWD